MVDDVARAGPGCVRGGTDRYRLARACDQAGISCVVAAPSRIRPAVDRVKTDRRDAERLARLLRLGEITPIWVPGPEEEAARDLVRAREDARGDLMRARHRLSKLLLRHGLVYDATAWTRAHDAWLRKQRFQSGPLAIVFDECYGRVVDAKTRRDALDAAIAELAATPPYVDVVERLVCRRALRSAWARRARERAERLGPKPVPVAELDGQRERSKRRDTMRHQPAHMSRDTNVDDSRCAPPAETKPCKKRGDSPCAVDRLPSI